MYTLVDFTTRVKGVEYLIAITAIASFILVAEILKAKPFKSLMDAIREDVKYVKENGLSLAKLMAAPLTGLVYLISLPFNFAFALAAVLKNGFFRMAGGNALFSWRPTEAYLFGHKKTKKRDAEGSRRSEKK
jgi:ABC-type sulfate transport system permease subunit